MSVLISILVIILQIIVGQLVGFGSAMALGVGNGWELLVIPVGNTLGVWFVGVLAAILRGSYAAKQYLIRLLGTLIGSGLGVGLILITPAFGGSQLLLPLLGAVIGFYLAPMINPAQTAETDTL